MEEKYLVTAAVVPVPDCWGIWEGLRISNAFLYHFESSMGI
jgi:hypothetical protein